MKIENIECYEEFNEYLNSYNYIIVNISASWCKPCINLKPFIEKYINSIEHTNFIYLKIDYSVYETDERFDTILKMKKIPFFIFIKNKNTEDFIVSSDFNIVSNKISNYINKYNENFFSKNDDF